MLAVAPAEDPLTIPFESALVSSEGAQVNSSELPTITFTEASGQLRLSAPEGHWDFSSYVAVGLDLENTGDSPVTLLGRLNDGGWSEGFLQLEEGERATMLLFLTRKRGEATPWMEVSFDRMRGIPGGYVMFRAGVDPARIEAIELGDLDGRSVGKGVRIHSIRGVGRYGVLSGVSEATLFPFVDRFGQYTHADWPGKVHSEAALRANAVSEAADLESHPGPTDRSRFGGWVDGPRFEATGHFRTTKHDGKWWLVDPEGYLFWSHGVTGVGAAGSATRVEGREHYFEVIPEGARDGPNARFGQANHALKYGEAWAASSRELAFRRLESWGMNTVGNWSEPATYLQGKAPYVVAIHYNGEPEVYLQNPEELRALLRERLEQEKGRTSEDPWCIGYFVDNEIKWRPDMDAELYYKIVAEEMERAAPHKLYLGSRFHDHNNPYGAKPFLMRAAARYCDVVGINRYRYSPADLEMLEGVDVPVIIGEFHFGALDRGMLHTGLRGVVNQEQRGRLYAHYVTEALKHPNIVGTHYFQYREQLVTGRFDGENYQIGLVDIADSPYQTVIEAARRVGEQLYQIRAEGE